MIRLKKAWPIALFLFCTVAFADDASQKEARELLDVLNMKVQFDQVVNTVIEQQLKQHPEMLPYKNVMVQFFNKYMSYDSLQDDLVGIYATEFTASELRDLKTFYSTPTGKKSISVMPALMSKGSQMGMKRVQDHTGELQQMLRDETARIVRLQQSQYQTNSSSPSNNVGQFPAVAFNTGNTSATNKCSDEEASNWLKANQSIINQQIHYPPYARAKGHEGKATVSLWVNEDGTVKDASIMVSSGNPELDEAAVKIGNAKYSPPVCGGVNVSIKAKVPVSFKLGDKVPVS